MAAPLMRRRTRLQHPPRGSVLLVAMLVLLLLGLLAGGLTRTGSLQLRMAGHEMAGTRADEAAQAMLDAMAPAAASFPLKTPPAYTRCDSETSCDDNSLAWPLDPASLGPASWRWQIFLQRMSPHWADSLPLRLTQGRVSSSLAFDVARVEAQVNLRTDSDQMGAQFRRGWALLAPAGIGEEIP